MRPLFICLAAMALASCDGSFFGLRNTYERTVAWKYGGTHYEMEFAVPADLYRYYDSLPKGMPYGRYVWEAGEYPYLSGIAGRLYAEVGHRGLTDAELAAYLLAFVQAVGYVPDPEGGEYCRFPVLTLIGGGDCEDLSILYASLCETLGLRAVLVGVPGHMLAAVRCGGAGYGYMFGNRKYLAAECAVEGWGLGEVGPETDTAWEVTLLRVQRPATFERRRRGHIPGDRKFSNNINIDTWKNY